MTPTLTYIKAQAQADDLQREAQRQRGHVEVRHVAVIRSAGAHFKLLPGGVSLAATGGGGRRPVSLRGAGAAASVT